MKLFKLTEENVEDPKIGIKYQTTSNGLAVKITSLKQMTVSALTIDELWDQRDKNKLADQIIKATFKPTNKPIRLSTLKEIASELANSVSNVDFIFHLSSNSRLDDLKSGNFSVNKVEYKKDILKGLLREASNDVQIISIRREMPDDPAQLKLKIKDQYYLYKDVGYDDIEYLRWMLRKGLGFKALNRFKAKGYEYEKI